MDQRDFAFYCKAIALIDMWYWNFSEVAILVPNVFLLACMPGES